MRLVAAAVAAVLTFGIAGVAAAVASDPVQLLRALARSAAANAGSALGSELGILAGTGRRRRIRRTSDSM